MVGHLEPLFNNFRASSGPRDSDLSHWRPESQDWILPGSLWNLAEVAGSSVLAADLQLLAAAMMLLVLVGEALQLLQLAVLPLLLRLEARLVGPRLNKHESLSPKLRGQRPPSFLRENSPSSAPNSVSSAKQLGEFDLAHTHMIGSKGLP